MTGASRQQLRALIDARRRQIIEENKVRAASRPCAGCGGRLDRYTAGCVTCRTRRNTRGKRAREARSGAAA